MDQSIAENPKTETHGSLAGESSSVLDVRAWRWPLVVGIALRLFFVWANEMDSGDWVARTVRAREFVRGLAPIWARTPWPEGNYLVPAIPMALGGDAYWSVRIFCAILSAAAIPLIYMAGKQQYGSRGGQIAAWLLACLPFHIYISANGAMTEGPFLVFVLASIVAATEWSKHPERVRWLIISALCVAGAESFRFDGVFVGAAIGLVAFFAKDERGSILKRPKILGAIAAYGIIALMYPIALLISWKAFYGDAMHMVKFAEENTTQFFAEGGHQRWPRWFYVTYCVAFWPIVAPAFALTPLVWLASWAGVWQRRARIATWLLVLPMLILTAFYMRAALAYTLLNQIRYVTALSIPLLAFFWIPFAAQPMRRRRLLLVATFASIAAVQLVPIDAAWHDRGVISRQLSTYSLIRPDQYAARDVVDWLSEHAAPGERVVFTPHAGSAWLTLATYKSPARISRLNIYRTTNLVYDSLGMVSAIRDSLRTANWVVASTSNNTEGLRDALVRELVTPRQIDAKGLLQWNGVTMRPAAEFGRLTVYSIAHDSIGTHAGLAGNNRGVATIKVVQKLRQQRLAHAGVRN